MRNFASALVVAWLAATAVAASVYAQTPKALYTDALSFERTLRLALDARQEDAPADALIKRIRTLVDSYERMSRLYPSSPYMDNALWQGALLASDAFWTFGAAEDRGSALKLFASLGSRFPTSSLVKQSAPYVKRLKVAKPTATDARQAGLAIPGPTGPASLAGPTSPPRPTSPTRLTRPANPGPLPASAPPGASAVLSAVRRDVLPDALRITLDLGAEVAFHSERISGPPRVFIDFENTRAVEGIKDATIPFSDDVVKQVRIGRQPDARTRVVMDLAGAGRHSVYALYNPYRVVIDFQRTATGAAASLARTPVTVAAATAAPVAPAPAVAPPAPDASAISGPAAAPASDIPASVEVEPVAEAPAAPAPAPPAANASGRFSLSRQLGLGVSRIVIDPGHGGHDPGAKTKGLTEANLVLDVALRLEQLLLKQDGFDVVLTRRVDTFVPLEERTAIANREGADLFLSIHANASARSSARGIETYFLNLAANPEAEVVAARENAASSRSMRQLPDIVRAIALNNKIRESRDFASMIQSSLAGQMQKTDRNVRNLGVKQAPFMVLLGATMPSVLAEISFITNRQDAALLKTEKHRQRIAEALYAGVVRYQQSLKVAPAVAEQ
jgi:N-acetylmuramoyl-L-alanine amidase